MSTLPLSNDSVGPRNEIASRGQAIYDEKIRHLVEPAEKGKLVVIDVDSGDYEVDSNHAAAVGRLNARHPSVITFTVRVGYSAAFKLGSRFRTPTQ
jgi:hypothetical protein